VPKAISPDAVVIGSGPNGLSAAVVCARAGLHVSVYEAESTFGGGARTAALTLPGFLHDRCSSVYPFGIASPFFRALPIERYGVEWRHPTYPVAHPLEDGDAVVVDTSLEATGETLGADGPTYRRLLTPFVQQWEPLVRDVLAPAHWPARPWLTARFGAIGFLPLTALARRFHTTRGRAVLAGMAAHSGQALDAPLTSAFALLFGTIAHALGWPVARGGAQSISDALAACLREHRAEIETGHRVDALAKLPRAQVTFCDLAPEHVAQLASDRLPPRFVRRLRRFRRRSGVFKLDWALDGPIPWRAQVCSQAGTVHVGGTFEEIAASEASPRHGRVSERPFVLVTQPSVCDPSRAPVGCHVAWGYCHVPVGATIDMSEAIERQIERFAPGFRDRVLARHVAGPSELMGANANLIGGDINGGAPALTQFMTRPTWRVYSTPRRDLYVCSSSTPPGAGVHGMCGYWAATTALRRLEIGTR